MNSSRQVTFLCDLAGGTTKLGKNQDFAENSAFLIKEEEKCLIVLISRQVVKGSRMERVPFFNRNGKSNPLPMSIQVFAYRAQCKEICNSHSSLSNRFKKTTAAATKAKITSVTCTNYFRWSHCGDCFSVLD